MKTDSIGKYISAIYRHQQILINNELKKYNIGSGQYIFLIELSINEGISQKELTRKVAIDKATTAKALKKLEIEEYIEKRVDLKDKRFHKLYLTEKGNNIMPVLKKTLTTIANNMSRSISSSEYNNTIRILKNILENVKDDVTKIKATKRCEKEK